MKADHLRSYFSEEDVVVEVGFAGGGDLITVSIFCPVSFFLCSFRLDTGSPFAGVGASRELTRSAFWSGPLLILSLLVLAM